MISVINVDILLISLLEIHVVVPHLDIFSLIISLRSWLLRFVEHSRQSNASEISMMQCILQMFHKNVDSEFSYSQSVMFLEQI